MAAKIRGILWLQVADCLEVLALAVIEGWMGPIVQSPSVFQSIEEAQLSYYILYQQKQKHYEDNGNGDGGDEDNDDDVDVDLVAPFSF